MTDHPPEVSDQTPHREFTFGGTPPADLSAKLEELLTRGRFTSCLPEDWTAEKVKTTIEKLGFFKVIIEDTAQETDSGRIGRERFSLRLQDPNKPFLDIARIRVVTDIPGTNLHVTLPMNEKCQLFVHDMSLEESDALRMVKTSLSRHRISTQEAAAYMVGLWAASAGNFVHTLKEVEAILAPQRAR